MYIIHRQPVCQEVFGSLLTSPLPHAILLYSMKGLDKRIAKVEGQIKGIGRMITEDRPCLEIVQQIIASRSALTEIGKRLLEEECLKCEDPEEREKIIAALFKIT